MSTSNRTLFIETIAAAVVTLGLVALASDSDVWMLDSGFHPGWIAILVMSARYGPRGLFLSLFVVVGSLVGAAALLDQSMDGLISRARSGSDFLALTSAVVVAWVAMLHEGRLIRADRQADYADARRESAEEIASALQDSLEDLRSRYDRVESSISWWRDIATRLERGDAAESARAALDLCVNRCGAQAGVVQPCGAEAQVIAWRGQWTATSPRPRDVSTDRTARAAVMTLTVTRVTDVANATEDDGDVAVPVLDEMDSSLLGVIVLRGVAPERLRAAEMRDLVLVAEWLSPALSKLVRKPRLHAVQEGSAV